MRPPIYNNLDSTKRRDTPHSHELNRKGDESAQYFPSHARYEMCQSRISAHFPGSSCDICSTSLSPRPERHCQSEMSANINIVTLAGKPLTMTMSDSFGNVAARRTPPQIACEDSRATCRGTSQFQKRELGHKRTGDDTLYLCQHPEPPQRLFVCGSYILCPPRILQPSMFWSHARVIETGADRVCLRDLASGGLKDVGSNAVENSRFTFGERRAVSVGFDTCASRCQYTKNVAIQRFY